MEQTSTIWVFKPIGWNPKDCIVECQKYHPNKKLSFAGRLDPMACGLLPIIINDSKNITRDELQDEYKTYKFNIILGFESDTFDILGIVKEKENKSDTITETQLNIVKETKSQTYPAYSSKTVFSPTHKKQMALWELAKLGLLPETLPTRDIDISDIHIVDKKITTNKELLDIVLSRLNTISDKSDFRKSDIIDCWNKLLNSNNETNYVIYSLEATVSSGTYIRTIANQLNGIAYDICRTSINNKKINSNDYDYFKFVYNI